MKASDTWDEFVKNAMGESVQLELDIAENK